MECTCASLHHRLRFANRLRGGGKLFKARLKSGDVILGLSRGEVESLVAYNPIAIKGNSIGLDHNILILFGETEIGIAADLIARGVTLVPKKTPKENG